MCVPGLYTYTRAYMPVLLFFGVVEVLKKSYFFFYITLTQNRQRVSFIIIKPFSLIHKCQQYIT